MDFGSNIFTAMIDEQGVIWEAGTGRKRQSVGVDSQKEQEYVKTIVEMQERLDQYYAKLVELGVITVPKSAEQIAQEAATQQAEINRALLEAISGLKTELGELRNGNAGSRDAVSIQSVGQNSPSDRKTPGANKGSNKSSAENAPGDNE